MKNNLIMQEKIERAKEILRQLDRITNRSFAIKARKMFKLQKALIKTKKQLGINC